MHFSAHDGDKSLAMEWSTQESLMASTAGVDRTMRARERLGLVDHLSQTTTQGQTITALAWLVIVHARMDPDRLKSTAHGKRPFLCCDALAGSPPAVITIL